MRVDFYGLLWWILYGLIGLCMEYLQWSALFSLCFDAGLWVCCLIVFVSSFNCVCMVRFFFRLGVLGERITLRLL